MISPFVCDCSFQETSEAYYFGCSKLDLIYLDPPNGAVEGAAAPRLRYTYTFQRSSNMHGAIASLLLFLVTSILAISGAPSARYEENSAQILKTGNRTLQPSKPPARMLHRRAHSPRTSRTNSPARSPRSPALGAEVREAREVVRLNYGRVPPNPLTILGASAHERNWREWAPLMADWLRLFGAHTSFFRHEPHRRYDPFPTPAEWATYGRHVAPMIHERLARPGGLLAILRHTDRARRPGSAFECPICWQLTDRIAGTRRGCGAEFCWRCHREVGSPPA